jgi:hypothetical protein
MSVYRLDYRLVDGISVPGRSNDGIFSLRFRVYTGSGPTQPTIKWVLGAPTPEREAGHSPPSSSRAKNAWNYTFSTRIYHGIVPNHERNILVLWCLVRHRDNFTITLPFLCALI